MSNWFLDKVTSSSFDENYEVKGRFDGKFNLWRRVVEFSKKDGFTSYWEVIGVFTRKLMGWPQKRSFGRKRSIIL